MKAWCAREEIYPGKLISVGVSFGKMNNKKHHLGTYDDLPPFHEQFESSITILVLEEYVSHSPRYTRYDDLGNEYPGKRWKVMITTAKETYEDVFGDYTLEKCVKEWESWPDKEKKKCSLD